MSSVDAAPSSFLTIKEECLGPHHDAGQRDFEKQPRDEACHPRGSDASDDQASKRQRSALGDDGPHETQAVGAERGTNP